MLEYNQELKVELIEKEILTVELKTIDIIPGDNRYGVTIINNYTAVLAPTVNDDSSEGYSVGSIWIDINTDKSYICVDATIDDAIWNEVGEAGEGISDIVKDITPQLGGDLDMNGHSIGGNTEAQLDSAVSLKHAQNSDTKLDEGNPNEISASQIKTDSTKLSGIESNATADQTNLEIQTVAKVDVDISDAITKKHDSSLIGTKTVDETDIADEKILKYNAISGKLEYKIDSGAEGGISEIVEDTTPQLGGDLDMNGHNIGGNTEAQIDDAVDKKHAHINKGILDNIQEALTTALKAVYDDAVTKVHSHSNKATLDATQEAFTTALKAIYDSCVTNEHAHANKVTLDLIEEAFTSALKTAYDDAVTKKHTHANKSTLDLIEQALTSALKTAYDDAVTKAHEHSNKTELDKVTDGDHDIITSGNPHNVSKSDVELSDVPNLDTTNAVDKAHTQNSDTDLDATFEATFMKKADNVKELADITSDGVDIEDAVTKKHDRSHSIVDSADHSDKVDYIDIPYSPTLLTGGILSEGTNAGTLKISALTALIRIDTGSTDALKKITLIEQDNLTLTSADIIYYIVLDYNSDSPQILIQEAEPNNNNQIQIGRCIKNGSNKVHYRQSGLRLQHGTQKINDRFRHLGEWMVHNAGIADKGSKQFSIASGHFFRGLTKIEWNLFDTSISAPDTFTYVYYNGSNWVYVDDQTDIDVDNYNNIATGLSTCNRYKCDWVFVHPDDGDVYVVYGQSDNNLGNIEDSRVPTLPDLIDVFGALIGRIIIDGGVATFERIEMIQYTTFNAQVVIDHNDNSNIQGGSETERYHTTEAQHTSATRDATNAQNGLMPSGVKDGYDDAVIKKHTQGTDQKLDEGGGNEISASQIKTDSTKLGLIEAEATTDQTGAEIKSAYEGEADTNAFTDTEKSKLSGIVNPMLFKGEINLAADFPTSEEVKNGWTYRIASDVTDNDPTKTNTDQTFTADHEISWNGINWTILGYGTVKSVNGETGVITLNQDNIGDGSTYKQYSNTEKTKLENIEANAVALATVKADEDIADAVTHKDLTNNPHNVGIDDLDLASGTVAADIDDAIDKKHTQNTDTHLGTVDQDIPLNTHKLTGLSVPDGNGQSVRTTTKITEVNLEDAIDKKHANTLDHTQGTDQKLDEGGGNEVTVANVKDAVDKKHSQNGDTNLESTFEATFMKKADNVKELADITSDGVDIEDAVTKKHTSGSESLGGDLSGTVSDAIINPDALVWQAPVIDKDLIIPPESPSEGDRYIIINTDRAGVWQKRDPAGTDNEKWNSIDLDDDGSNLIVGAEYGRLYTSSDSGANWTERQPAGNDDKRWRAVASDGDGSNLIAGIYIGRLYTSDDYGANWTETQPAGDTGKNWEAVASDSDGSFLIAGVNGGRLYTSDDYGANWTERRPDGADEDNFWTSCACSNNGQFIIVGNSTRLYTSSDYGASWAERQPAGDENFNWRVACSDEAYFIVANRYRLYTSPNQGINWSETKPAGDVDKDWRAVASDGDGSFLIASEWDGHIYTSSDSGANWTDRTPVIYPFTSDWGAVATDVDGGHSIVGIYQGRLYTAYNSWFGHENDIAQYINSSWSFFTPQEGWKVYVGDEKKWYKYTNSTWSLDTSTGDMEKSTYDTDENGIVDKAETLTDGDSGNEVTYPQAQDAVDKAHTQNSDTDLDTTFEATFVKKTDNVKELADITSDGADIEDAVTKKHTQGSDTALGAQSENLDMNTNKIVGVVDPTENQEAATKKYVDDNSINNVIEDTTPELGGEMDAGEHSIGFTEKTNVVVTNAVTIDWKVSNKQLLTVDDNVTITFTAPSNPCNLVLRILQSGAGHVTTLPSIKTVGGEGITVSDTDGAIDLIAIYYDGTSYYAMAGLLFS